ncbi:serine hydrolase [uncultured Erythrobacter sp.]|uniref:serine hydrolase domain-containing protein n=1 Tax=uncultured Erythrobacter sp. TaxID=263913 RepID=UPI002633BBD9|nr:serine hydrolase [uncultured Erythrobacter sp.]
MKTLLSLAATAALALTTTASAQSAQERLDDRYNYALAAGYKAMMLCSAMATSERLGGSRTEESVHEWELTGIYPVLDPIIRDLPYEIVRYSVDGMANPPVYQVRVEWADDMPARAATQSVNGGCYVEPIGASLAEPLPLSAESANANVADDGWTTNSAVLSGSAKDRLGDAAFDMSYGEGSRTTAALVIRGDAIIMERYAQGFGADTPQRTWSVAKSIASTLVGIGLLADGIDVNEPIGLNYWRQGGAPDLRNQITIDHALRMATGRYSDTPGNRTDPLYWGGSTVDETAMRWPVVHAPGTVFRYANNDTLLAVRTVDRFLGYYGAEDLLSRFGMDRTIAETDWRGGYVLSSQVWSTARDLGRLGQLYLNDGVWDGERILPEGWVEYISDPSGPQPEGTDWGYGAGWWTFRRPEGNAFEGIPDDAFAARGNRGQYVVVVPSRDVVIVRRGEDMVGTRFDIAAFTRDVLAALEEGGSD